MAATPCISDWSIIMNGVCGQLLISSLPTHLHSPSFRLMGGVGEIFLQSHILSSTTAEDDHTLNLLKFFYSSNDVPH
jgi:hypothetical protein